MQIQFKKIFNFLQKWSMPFGFLMCSSLSIQNAVAQQNQTPIPTQQENNTQNTNAAQEVNQLIAKYQSFSANIEQTQFKPKSAKNDYIKSSFKKADFSFLKPFYFSWKYEAPAAQTIVSDGQYIYIYQDALNQLIKKEAKNILAQSPIQLVFNDKINQLFVIEKLTATNFISKNNKWFDLLKVSKNQYDSWGFFELNARQNNNLYQKILMIRSENNTLKYLAAQTALGVTVFEFKNITPKTFQKNDFMYEKHIKLKEKERS